MSEAIAAAFLVGLAGSGHCLGMCGGIVGALALGLPATVRARRASLLTYLLLYNAGRIASYTLAGALAGAAGGSLFVLIGVDGARLAGRIVAGGFMLALGVYLAGWWPALAGLEKWGMVLWRRLEPLGRRLLPVHRPRQALALGLVWGWLPCGMVYSALVLALTAGGAARGAAVMTAFGLGTLPTLLLVGAAAGPLGRLLQHPLARRVAGTIIIGLALYVLSGPWGASGQPRHH